MNQTISALILVFGLAFAYQSYQNSQLTRDTERMARAHACAESEPSCKVTGDRPREMQAGPTSRRYRWKTTKGEHWTICTRQWWLYGAWSCKRDSDN